MNVLSGVSERRACRVLGVNRSAKREEERSTRPASIDEVLATRVQRLIQRHPTYGYRRLWALLRFGEGLRVNRKAAAHFDGPNADLVASLVVAGWRAA